MRIVGFKIISILVFACVACVSRENQDVLFVKKQGSWQVEGKYGSYDASCGYDSPLTQGYLYYVFALVNEGHLLYFESRDWRGDEALGNYFYVEWEGIGLSIDSKPISSNVEWNMHDWSGFKNCMYRNGFGRFTYKLVNRGCLNYGAENVNQSMGYCRNFVNYIHSVSHYYPLERRVSVPFLGYKILYMASVLPIDLDVFFGDYVDGFDLQFSCNGTNKVCENIQLHRFGG